MKTALLACCVLLSVETSASEADAAQLQRQPLDATYTIYSGEPGERQAPTPKDKKIAITIKGKAASEIFNSIGPDSSVTCTTTTGERLREKGELWCSYRPQSGYTCYLGFDLNTGRPSVGTSC